MADSGAIFIGGPRDGMVTEMPDSALVEVPEGGLTHRYVLTKATRERDGATYRVLNYDGEIRNAQADPDVKAPDGHPGSGT